MQIFLQYCYSAILCLELHCSKYCKKIIIFYYVERGERPTPPPSPPIRPTPPPSPPIRPTPSLYSLCCDWVCLFFFFFLIMYFHMDLVAVVVMVDFGYGSGSCLWVWLCLVVVAMVVVAVDVAVPDDRGGCGWF